MKDDLIIDLASRRASHVEMPADCASDRASFRPVVGATTRNIDPRPIDCSRGDQRGVVISEDTARLLAQAFVDLANERRITAMDISGAEGICRAFQEIELMRKALW